MKLLGSNHKTAAAWNRGLAIQLLRRHGTLSRHDISKMTQLQGSTLSYIVRELINKNVVRTVGKRQSTQVGQKQVLLTLNSEMGWVVGVSLRPELATLVLLDAAGGRIDGMRTATDGAIETFPRQINAALKRWLSQRGTPSGKMLGIGVGVAGVVDADAGVVLRSIPLNCINVPLRNLFADEFGVTAVVDHDACYGACFEAADGGATDMSHFAYMSINATATGDGIRLTTLGSALYLEGKIYRGAFYAAGELHEGPLAHEPMIFSYAEMEQLTDPEGSMPPALVEFARRVGVSVGPLCNLIDVQMVVLAGTAGILNRRFVSAVQATVTDLLVGIPGRSVRVIRGTVALEAVARGAAIAAFDAILAQGQLFGDADERKVIRTGKEPLAV